MIVWILGTYLQWTECKKLLYIGHLYNYCILKEGLSNLLIKLDVYLIVLEQLDSIFWFSWVFFCLGGKYPVHTNEIITIICEVYLPITFGSLKDIILSCISFKSDIVILFDDIHGITCLFYSVLEYIELPITTQLFCMASNLIKCPNTGYVIIPRVEDVD